MVCAGAIDSGEKIKASFVLGRPPKWVSAEKQEAR